MTASLVVEATGLVYRNPRPHVSSIVAYHPSVVPIGSTEYLATFDLGQAVEAMDYHTVAARSIDGGERWQLEGPLLEKTPPLTTHSIRTSRLRDGSLVGFGALHNRIDPEAGLVNRETFGFVPVDLFLMRSHDSGRSWEERESIMPPLRAPTWEICHPIVELASGRWLAPAATWRDWDGQNAAGEQAVVFISDDRGHSWPRFGRVFDGRVSGHSHFEQSVVELADGRLLAVAWIYESASGRTLPTMYTTGSDGGETFGAPRETGFLAQTTKLTALPDGSVFCAYRRNDAPGLWATLARLEGERWQNLAEAPLWQGAESGMAGRASGGDELAQLRFGYPSACRLSEGRLLVLFWCQEECLTVIRWLRVRIA
jgi:sialidase-1